MKVDSSVISKQDEDDSNRQDFGLSDAETIHSSLPFDDTLHHFQ